MMRLSRRMMCIARPKPVSKEEVEALLARLDRQVIDSLPERDIGLHDSLSYIRWARQREEFVRLSRRRMQRDLVEEGCRVLLGCVLLASFLYLVFSNGIYEKKNTWLKEEVSMLQIRLRQAEKKLEAKS